MLDVLRKMIKSELMYYVIVPITIPIIGWVKNWYNVKSKNKKMGYWKIRIRKDYSFSDIAMKAYKYMAINVFVMQAIRIICSLLIGKTYLDFIIGIICTLVNIFIMIYIIKRPNTKLEFLSDGKVKKRLLWILWCIFSLSYFIELIQKKLYVIEIGYWIILVIWCFFLYKCTDIVLILDKSYADIYINSAETVRYIYAGSMKKKGEWIYVNRYVEGHDEEVRIKESEIVRIDYYGEPIVILEKFGPVSRFSTK